ncbi:MAG: sodium-dependent transporter [Eggerthellaceae bacterium]|jgi:NSS family neurotransmitter:Na+ symporter|nr:sodium-dependent transporter [Eggerthellaceae bacterium]
MQGQAESTITASHSKPYVRAHFSSQFAFVLAAAASAVGLGNLWRFPYLAAKYGGGAFLITYLALVLTFGFTLMLIEVAIGRHTGLSAIHAFRALSKRFAFIGVIESIAPIIIISYYCVIGGWILKYLVEYVQGAGSIIATDTFFNGYISQSIEPIVYCSIFASITMVIVASGVKKGIERLNKISMPLLIILSVFLSIYVMLQPGAIDGLSYYLIPDMDRFGFGTIVAAMGQMFFSMSLASGVMITYGSYMSKKDDLTHSVSQIEIFDTLVAFLAGLIIVPSVFVFSGGEASAMSAGPGLMFVTLPKVFLSLPFGEIIGFCFFALVLFAAITSSVSIAEAVISIFGDAFRWWRKKSVAVVWIGILLISMLPSLGYGAWSSVTFAGLTILDLMDFCVSSVLMPLGALLTCIMLGWFVGPQVIVNEVEQSAPFKRKRLFLVMLKWVSPVFLVVILVSSCLNTFGLISI